MSKEKQIEELTNELIRTNGYGTLNAVANHLYNEGYRKKSEWISVEERLPDTTEKILVYCSNGEILPAKYIRVQGLEFWFEETYSCHNITHWMPLPEPPKKGGGEE